MKHLIIIISLAFLTVVSCKKKTSDPTPDPAPSSTTGSTTSSNTALSSSTQEYIKYKLSIPPSYTNHNYSLAQPTSGIWNISSGANINIQPSLPNYYNDGHAYVNSSNQSTFFLDKVDSTSMTTISNAFLINQYKIGINYPYATTGVMGNAGYTGMKISVKDSVGAMWSTINPAAGKPSLQSITTTYKIVETTNYSNSSNQFTIKNKINFSCKLYNSAGDSLYLTGGEMVTSVTK